MRPLRIAFDVGGVLSKYPDQMFMLIEVLQQGGRHVRLTDGSAALEVHIVSDMHPVDKITDMLRRNGFAVPGDQVHSADFKTHGEACKAVLCAELGIDVLIDDYIGYVATPGSPPVRLLVMPDASRPYYAEQWQTDGSEGDFGRHNQPGSKKPPEDRPRPPPGSRLPPEDRPRPSVGCAQTTKTLHAGGAGVVYRKITVGKLLANSDLVAPSSGPKCGNCTRAAIHAPLLEEWDIADGCAYCPKCVLEGAEL